MTMAEILSLYGTTRPSEIMISGVVGVKFLIIL